MRDFFRGGRRTMETIEVYIAFFELTVVIGTAGGRTECFIVFVITPFDWTPRGGE